MTLDVSKISASKTAIEGMDVNKINTSLSSLLNLSTVFGGSDDGFAIDFTTASGLFVDNLAADPVDTDGDLIGYATDETGNGNHFTQGTTANKPQWVEGEGVQANDSTDLLVNTFGATLATYTVVIYAELTSTGFSGTENLYNIWVNSNNNAGIRRTAAGTVQANSAYTGVARNLSIKTGFSGTSSHTMVGSNDSASPYGIFGQWDDDTQLTTSRAATSSWGTEHRIGVGCDTTKIHRILMVDKVLTGSDLANAKTMVQNGWAS